MSEGWERRAACRDLTPKQIDAAFFPWQSIASGKGEADYTEARTFCDRCPVRADCLGVALTAERGTSKGSRFGMFGGLTPHQRWARDRGGELLDGERRCLYCNAPFMPVRSNQTACCRRCRVSADQAKWTETRRDRGAA